MAADLSNESREKIRADEAEWQRLLAEEREAMVRRKEAREATQREIERQKQAAEAHGS